MVLQQEAAQRGPATDDVLRPTHLPAQLVVRSSTAPARSESNPTAPARERAA